MMTFLTAVRLILSLLFSLLFGVMAGTPLAYGESRAEALQDIQNLIEKNHSRLEQLSSATPDLLPALAAQTSEHLLRQDFLNRLSLQIDRYFQGGDLKSFLEVRLQHLAKLERTAPLPQSNLVLFLTHLAMALKNLPEKHEDPVEFIEGYLKFSSILQPQKPEDYTRFRHYYNGRSFQTVPSVEKE